MCSGIIPEGTYELKVGESFLLGSSSSGGKGGKAPEFNTLRFDFKPASISSGSEAYIAESQNENDFQVIVPGGEGQRPTIFKGAKKAIKGDKECLLVYDERTKELRLERVSANIFVKKTRDTELDANVRSQIGRLEKKKGKTTKKVIVQPPVEQPVEKQQQQREQAVQPQKAEKEGKERGDQAVQQQQQQKREKTVSMSSAGEEESGEYDDENVSALEQLMGGPSPITSSSPKMASSSPPKKNGEPPVKKQPSPVKKSSSFVKKSILAEDLQLSESSSSEEDGEEDEE